MYFHSVPTVLVLNCKYESFFWFVCFLKVKTEEVDLQLSVPLIDNLIDFTDPTPAVSSSSVF